MQQNWKYSGANIDKVVTWCGNLVRATGEKTHCVLTYQAGYRLLLNCEWASICQPNFCLAARSSQGGTPSFLIFHLYYLIILIYWYFHNDKVFWKEWLVRVLWKWFQKHCFVFKSVAFISSPWFYFAYLRDQYRLLLPAVKAQHVSDSWL